ncbi:MAG: ExbD/TolR family protein [Phycisphaeraceae bacterium]
MSEQRPTTNTPERDEPTVHHVPRRKKQALRPARMQVNLTSMIDVTFLLLIYFIITANFMLDEGVLIARMPQGTGQAAEETDEPPEQPLEIELIPDPPAGVRIHIAGERGINTFTDLAQQLQSWQVTPSNPGGIYKPDNPVIIKPVGEVRWQHVVNAFNAAIKSRYSNVAFGQPSQQ